MSQRKIYDISKSGQSLPEANGTPVIRRGGGTIFLGFVTKVFGGIFYLAVIVLASAGVTTLLNGQLREMLFKLVRNLLCNSAYIQTKIHKKAFNSRQYRV